MLNDENEKYATTDDDAATKTMTTTMMLMKKKSTTSECCDNDSSRNGTFDLARVAEFLAQESISPLSNDKQGKRTKLPSSPPPIAKGLPIDPENKGIVQTSLLGIFRPSHLVMNPSLINDGSPTVLPNSPPPSSMATTLPRYNFKRHSIAQRMTGIDDEHQQPYQQQQQRRPSSATLDDRMALQNNQWKPKYHKGKRATLNDQVLREHLRHISDLHCVGGGNREIDKMGLAMTRSGCNEKKLHSHRKQQSKSSDKIGDIVKKSSENQRSLQQKSTTREGSLKQSTSGLDHHHQLHHRQDHYHQHGENKRNDERHHRHHRQDRERRKSAFAAVPEIMSDKLKLSDKSGEHHIVIPMNNGESVALQSYDYESLKTAAKLIAKLEKTRTSLSVASADVPNQVHLLEGQHGECFVVSKRTSQYEMAVTRRYRVAAIAMSIISQLTTCLVCFSVPAFLLAYRQPRDSKDRGAYRMSLLFSFLSIALATIVLVVFFYLYLNTVSLDEKAGLDFY